MALLEFVSPASHPGCVVQCLENCQLHVDSLFEAHIDVGADGVELFINIDRVVDQYPPMRGGA